VTDLAIFLAEQVRKLRTQAAMTQAELASRAGVTVETVARLERVLRGRASANANPSLETMERIASSLGVDVADLVSPSKVRPKDDRLNVVLRGASGPVRRRVLLVAEALIRDELSEARQAKADSKLKKSAKRR
jgi:transcriptional regulator with XRE-family HTH domain